MGKHLIQHGDGVRDIAMTVEDATKVYEVIIFIKELNANFFLRLQLREVLSPLLSQRSSLTNMVLSLLPVSKHTEILSTLLSKEMLMDKTTKELSSQDSRNTTWKNLLTKSFLPQSSMLLTTLSEMVTKVIWFPLLIGTKIPSISTDSGLLMISLCTPTTLLWSTYCYCPVF